MNKFIFLITIVTCVVFVSAGPVKLSKRVQYPDGCVCEKFSCSCCAHMEVPQIGINDTACIDIGYDPNDYGVHLVVTIDDTVLINETISARNPPPICLPIPYIEDFVDGCIHFTDLSIKNTDFHGCAALEFRMWWVYVVAEIELGCWDTADMSKEHLKMMQSLAKKKNFNATSNAV